LKEVCLNCFIAIPDRIGHEMAIFSEKALARPGSTAALAWKDFRSNLAERTPRGDNDGPRESGSAASIELGGSAMNSVPTPPDTYQAFVQRYPKMGQAWECLAEAGKEGPLDARTMRLVKLAVAIGALRQGAVHASIRKALAQGITRAEIEQVIALSAGTLGLPATVAVFSWVQDVLAQSGPKT
jgi:alkylhydroperoxidase/carboxymuconolactone decarboxylase family protein YurZ